tara:strand:+ start:1165 stop:1338 length:174 start_codon:yes stop_codon:yes gene_type:complete
MELIILVLFVVFVAGLIIRKRGDNTMDTMSKGCGCIIGTFVLLIIAYVVFLYYKAHA